MHHSGLIQYIWAFSYINLLLIRQHFSLCYRHKSNKYTTLFMISTTHLTMVGRSTTEHENCVTYITRQKQIMHNYERDCHTCNELTSMEHWEEHKHEKERDRLQSLLTLFSFPLFIFFFFEDFKTCHFLSRKGTDHHMSFKLVWTRIIN